MLDINDVINWQLSKQGIRWPVSLDLIEVKYFFEVIRWQVTSFQMIEGSICCVYVPHN